MYPSVRDTSGSCWQPPRCRSSVHRSRSDFLVSSSISEKLISVKTSDYGACGLGKLNGYLWWYLEVSKLPYCAKYFYTSKFTRSELFAHFDFTISQKQRKLCHCGWILSTKEAQIVCAYIAANFVIIAIPSWRFLNLQMRSAPSVN